MMHTNKKVCIFFKAIGQFYDSKCIVVDGKVLLDEIFNIY